MVRVDDVPIGSVQDLEAVIAAARPAEPFVLLGISQGGATAIRYAVAHPGKVSHLILYGAYAQGRAKMGDPEAEQAQRARIALTRTGWGQDNPVYRQLFTSRFIPAGTDEQLRDFHAVWIDAEDGIWAVGGDLSFLSNGVVAYGGPQLVSNTSPP